MEIIEDPLQLLKNTLQHIDSAITGTENRMELYPNPNILKNAENEMEHLRSVRKKYIDAVIEMSGIQREKEVNEFISTVKMWADAAVYPTLLDNLTSLTKRLRKLETKDNIDEIDKLTRISKEIEKRLKEITDKYIIRDVCTEVQPRTMDDESDSIICNNCGHRIR